MPTDIGELWVAGTDSEIRGHANSTSNFPAPGDDFYGLKMGATLDDGESPDVSSSSDITPYVLVTVVAVALVLMAAWFYMRKKR